MFLWGKRELFVKNGKKTTEIVSEITRCRKIPHRFLESQCAGYSVFD